MNLDPLFVVNSKTPCVYCQTEEQQSRIPKDEKCSFCHGTGYTPANIGGMWAPSSGFLVCGGPSVNKLPFHKLKERGIVSLAVNNVAGHVPVTSFCFSDPQSKFHHGVFLDPKIITFAPIAKLKKRIRAKLPDGTFRGMKTRVKHCPSTFGFDRKTTFDAKTFLTTEYAHWGRGGKQSEENKPFTCLCTMLLGIRLMHYMGCRRVYLLGVDFLRTEEAQYSFEQTAGLNNGRYRHENAMLAELKPYFDLEGFHLFNCNPESGCDVFPKVSFDDAFEDCKGAVPDEPFDMADWYNKGIAEEQEKLYPDLIDVNKLSVIQKMARKVK
jgi:hypothetical protein